MYREAVPHYNGTPLGCGCEGLHLIHMYLNSRLRALKVFAVCTKKPQPDGLTTEFSTVTGANYFSQSSSGKEGILENSPVL